MGKKPRIVPSKIPHVGTGHIPVPTVQSGHVVFNFRYLKEDGEVSILQPKEWHGKNVGICALVNRLKSITERTRTDIETDWGLQKQLHYHRIDFKDSGVTRSGFGLGLRGADDNAYQFSITVNTGRLHGFWEGNIFYVVWLDLDHRLMPGKGR